MGTDVSNGPTGIAVAIADCHTSDHARRSGVDLSDKLAKHDSSNVSRILKDEICTNDTRANLIDLMVVYVVGK